MDMDVVINSYSWQGLQSYDIVTRSHTFISVAGEEPNQRQLKEKLIINMHFNKYFKDISTIPLQRKQIKLPF